MSLAWITARAPDADARSDRVVIAVPDTRHISRPSGVNRPSSPCLGERNAPWIAITGSAGRNRRGRGSVISGGSTGLAGAGATLCASWNAPAETCHFCGGVFAGGRGGGATGGGLRASGITDAGRLTCSVPSLRDANTASCRRSASRTSPSGRDSSSSAPSTNASSQSASSGEPDARAISAASASAGDAPSATSTASGAGGPPTSGEPSAGVGHARPTTAPWTSVSRGQYTWGTSNCPAIGRPCTAAIAFGITTRPASSRAACGVASPAAATLSIRDWTPVRARGRSRIGTSQRSCASRASNAVSVSVPVASGSSDGSAYQPHTRYAIRPAGTLSSGSWKPNRFCTLS